MSNPYPRILVYLLRRDLRISDNPVLHEISRLWSSSNPPFTHLLPIYVFPAEQVEVSGFLSGPEDKSPYPEARSRVAGFWRCGPHRAKFLAESVWDLKGSLEQAGCGLAIRAGTFGDVVRDALEWRKGDGEAVAEESSPETSDRGSKSPSDTKTRSRGEVVGVWMTSEEGFEEEQQEQDVKSVVDAYGKEFRLWTDEKYYIDEFVITFATRCLTHAALPRRHQTCISLTNLCRSRDLPFTNTKDLPDVYTSFRKSVEPLRDRPRVTLPAPTALPPLPPAPSMPPQSAPFTIPNTLDDLISSLQKPLEPSLGLSDPPRWPPNTRSAHPFTGGETTGQARIRHLINSGAMSAYKDTRNGLLGEDFSTKLSAWLALGSITSRQVHASMLAFENGEGEDGRDLPDYGKGENKGTAAVRFELLWRDYMRLCTRKFGARLFRESGFRGAGDKKAWKYINRFSGLGDDPSKTREVLARWQAGTTGTGLIDASNREVFLTGYTSNRARQNVASFFSKELGIDWRIGSEWYECILVDYDVSSNWGNWQYVAGVGNDPRQGRTFNPVKQALEYDRRGEFVKAWIPELRELYVDHGTDGGDQGQQLLMGLFQAWRISEKDRQRLGLKGVDWVERPLVKVPFSVGRRPREAFSGSRGRGRGRGRGGDGRRGGGRGRWRSGPMDKANDIDDGIEMNEGAA